MELGERMRTRVSVHAGQASTCAFTSSYTDVLDMQAFVSREDRGLPTCQLGSL